MRLEDKVALITGAASGIGRESALLFAKEGASVVAVDIDDEKGEQTVTEIKEKGGRALYVHADVSCSDDCRRMIETAEETFGKLQVLFNNAGIMDSGDSDAVETDEGVWDRTMTVNLKSVYLGCKYGIPALRRAGGGSLATGVVVGHVVYLQTRANLLHRFLLARETETLHHQKVGEETEDAAMIGAAV